MIDDPVELGDPDMLFEDRAVIDRVDVDDPDLEEDGEVVDVHDPNDVLLEEVVGDIDRDDVVVLEEDVDPELVLDDVLDFVENELTVPVLLELVVNVFIRDGKELRVDIPERVEVRVAVAVVVGRAFVSDPPATNNNSPNESIRSNILT